MFEVLLVLGGVAIGYALGDTRHQIAKWLADRAEANKVKAAQALIDAENAAEKALADAKALLRSQLPPIPANPLPAGNPPATPPAV